MKGLMGYLKLFCAQTYLIDKLLTRKTLSVFFSVLGAMGLMIHITSYLSTQADTFLKGNMTMFLVVLSIAVVCTVFHRRPDVEIKEQIGGIDTFIKIKVGNVMEANESCVVSTNTTFDTDMANNLISVDSLQGQFTERYYDLHCAQLDADIVRALQNVTDIEDLSGQEARKGKTKKYPLGTVAKVRAKDRTFYLLSIADMGQSGNAECDFRMISDALNSLWQFLGKAGDYEKELLIPILGTGHGRVRETREEIIQETINSFIAASTQKRVCETLTIVIYSDDFYKFTLQMEDLKHYLSAQCRYSRIRRSSGGGTGESL